MEEQTIEKVYAYIRVSTDKQILENQRHEIERYATHRGWTVHLWVEEVVSGTRKVKFRQLHRLLRRLRKGDRLLVSEISRLSRSMLEGMTLLDQLVRRQVELHSIKENIVFDNSISSKVLSFVLSMAAEMERTMISTRTKEGLALRRKQGITLGRRKGSCSQQQRLDIHLTAIQEALAQGITINELCLRYKVSRSTFQRWRQQHHKKEAP